MKHYGVGRFASWLFESVASSLVVVGVDVSRETIPLTQRILLIYLLCFTWNMGNACEGNLLRLRLCFEACFMGWGGLVVFSGV